MIAFPERRKQGRAPIAGNIIAYSASARPKEDRWTIFSPRPSPT